LLARTLLAAARGIDHVLHWSLFRAGSIKLAP
jgi:hypothetical protein